MGAVYFYHLTRSPLENALPQLLERALGNDWRVALRAATSARLDQLDQALWLGEGFLPHGLAGGPHDADQPILLSTGTSTANNPACLMSVEGAAVSAEDVQTLERACVLFDGNDEAALDVARSQWKALTQAGCSAQYWSEESGRWQMKARS